MPFIAAPTGVKLWFESAGEGAPLVFIHGWGMSCSVWHSLRDLAMGHRVIVLDLRGHGQSSDPPTGYGFEEFTSDIAFLFEQLKLDDATLVGWSMGASVALAAWARLRERLSAMVLISGTPKFTASEDYPFGLPAVAAKGLALRLKRNHLRTMSEFFVGMFAEGEIPPAESRRLEEVVSAGGVPRKEAALASLEALASADFRPLLPGIDLPVLLIHGSADTICLSSASRCMAKLLPNARLDILDGVGHAPFLSRPSEITASITTFLDGVYAHD